MYSLTNNCNENCVVREQLFKNILKNGFTKQNLKDYNTIREEEICRFLEYKSKPVDLGNELRSILAAFTIQASVKGYSALCSVKGECSVLMPLDYFEHFFCKTAAECLISSKDKKITVNAVLRRSTVSLSIESDCLSTEKCGIFSVKKNEECCTCYFNARYPETKCQDYTKPWLFICDRLSAVNLNLSLAEL